MLNSSSAQAYELVCLNQTVVMSIEIWVLVANVAAPCFFPDQAP
jgi:hypothetical protein